VVGIGGSGGTALITPAMRALPIGLPKLMVSTVASGNTAPYVGCSDITLMYSVVDVAGLNSVSRRILGNAAHAMAGMVQQPETFEAQQPTLGLTMFGVTTPCVTAVRQALEARGYDCLVFHATGAGGRQQGEQGEAHRVIAFQPGYGHPEQGHPGQADHDRRRPGALSPGRACSRPMWGHE